MKKNKILSLLTIVSLWGSVALSSLEQLRLGHCVVVFTKDESGNTRTYVSQVPEENATVDGLIESLSIVDEGQICYAQPIDNLHYAIEVPMQNLASDQGALPFYIHFTLQVEQGQELLRVMIVKNNFFDDKLFDVATVAIDDVDEFDDDLDALLADSKTDSLDSIDTPAAKTISSSQQVILSLSVFLIDQYNKGQEMLITSSEWINGFFK